GPLTIFTTAGELLDRLRPSIPATIDPNVIKVLDRLPDQEKKLPQSAKAEGETAAPKVPQDTSIPKPEDIEKVKFGSQPEPGYDEAAAKALQAAYVQLSKTELGKQLEQSVKSYVLSAEGIPLDAVVAGGVLTFVATNDPKLPSVPEIPIGEGVKIKIDYSGRASDLPPLVRDLLRGHSGEVPQP